MRKIEITFDLSLRCPKCGNPNCNIEGSVYGLTLHYKVSCMQCGKIFHKVRDVDLVDDTPPKPELGNPIVPNVYKDLFEKRRGGTVSDAQANSNDARSLVRTTQG